MLQPAWRLDVCQSATATFRTSLLFSALRRFVAYMPRAEECGLGCRAELMRTTTGMTDMSMKLEIRQQQSCLQFTFRINSITRDIFDSAFSPDESVLNFC